MVKKIKKTSFLIKIATYKTKKMNVVENEENIILHTMANHKTKKEWI